MNRLKSLLSFGALFACLSLIFLFSGCATGDRPATTTYIDQMNGLRTDLLGDNTIDEPGNDRELIQLNASRLFRNFRKYEFYLEIQYAARTDVGFLDIYPGASLTLIVDGKEMKFAGIGSVNNRKDDKGLVMEDATYKATAEEIRTIANANEVTVRVAGKNGVVVRKFAAENFEKFRQFSSQFATEQPK